MRELENLCLKYNNVYIRINGEHFADVPQLQKKNIKFFFDYSFLVYSYSLLEWVIKIHPTDIYIGEELFYNLNEVKNICDNHNIKIRMILNRIPVTNNFVAFNYSVLAFRPQDYSFLEKYIDVGEFDCEEPYDWTKADILYRKWYIEHSWNDDLSYMNKDMVLPFPVQSMPIELIKYRSNCKHRCMTSANSHCHKCKRFFTLGIYNDKQGIKYKDDTKSTLPSLDELTDKLLLTSEQG